MQCGLTYTWLVHTLGHPWDTTMEGGLPKERNVGE